MCSCCTWRRGYPEKLRSWIKLKSITNVTGQWPMSECKNATDPGCTNMEMAQTAPRLVPFRRTCTNVMRTHFSVTRAVPRRIAKRCGLPRFVLPNYWPGPWTCHGSTCQQKYQCQDACGLSLSCWDMAWLRASRSIHQW